MNELNLCLVQTELVWHDIGANLDHFDNVLESIEVADLVILPEMFSTGFSMASQAFAESMDGRAVSWMTAFARRKQTAICGSLMIRHEQRFYNRFVYASAAGEQQIYDKKHLFRMSAENEHYSPGTDFITFSLKNFHLCPQVCYDLRFPVWSRNRAGYDLLIYVANWPASRRLQWLTLLQARAIENQSYVVGVNRIGTDGNGVEYAGDTVAIDFNGRIISNLGDRNCVQYVTINKDELTSYRQKFPAWRDADSFRFDDASP